MPISRRALLGATAGAAIVPPLLSTANAAAPFAAAQAPGVYRYKVGGIEITALHDGAAPRQLEGFVRNAELADIRKELADAFLPTDSLLNVFTTLVVNTGSRLTLIDTGRGGPQAASAGRMLANLKAAGLEPGAVDEVIISHFHGDHIGGLVTAEGTPVFPNAGLSVPAPEWAYWMDEGQMSRAPEAARGNFRNARRIFGAFEDVRRYDADVEVSPGITAIATPGHTPGHTSFRISSGSDQLLILSDLTSHPTLFVRNPGWHAVFDMDANMAEATRRKVLDMAAADRIRIAGYHYPFPATGFIEKRGSGFNYVPVQWAPL